MAMSCCYCYCCCCCCLCCCCCSVTIFSMGQKGPFSPCLPPLGGPGLQVTMCVCLSVCLCFRLGFMFPWCVCVCHTRPDISPLCAIFEHASYLIFDFPINIVYSESCTGMEVWPHRDCVRKVWRLKVTKLV